jgi:hypothetical protein
MRARTRLMFTSTVRLDAPRQLNPVRRTSSWRLTGTPGDCARATSSRNSWGRRSTHSPFTHAAWFFVSSRRSPNSRIRWLPAARPLRRCARRPGQQCLRGKGLRDVVVGARLEAWNLVLFGVAVQHEDHHLLVRGPDSLADRDYLGQCQVEQNNVRLPGRARDLHRLLPVAGGHDLKPLASQPAREGGAFVRVFGRDQGPV